MAGCARQRVQQLASRRVGERAEHRSGRIAGRVHAAISFGPGLRRRQAGRGDTGQVKDLERRVSITRIEQAVVIDRGERELDARGRLPSALHQKARRPSGSSSAVRRGCLLDPAGPLGVRRDGNGPRRRAAVRARPRRRATGQPSARSPRARRPGTGAGAPSWRSILSVMDGSSRANGTTCNLEVAHLLSCTQLASCTLALGPEVPHAPRPHGRRADPAR